ncbi:IS30 family transposase [Celeribacter sp.]|uniref:IS30 family transposase n=1 Tax=Celeribacter sp. TaxID=1890673 RepID=UPI003A8E312F
MTKPLPMNEQNKSVIWDAWENGTPMANIARVIDKPPATVFSYLQYHGGIRPRRRFRRAEALSLEEREEISRGISHGLSVRSIARILHRSPSTICREINKNGGPKRYRAIIADKAAWRRGKRPKAFLLSQNSALKDLVDTKLCEDWSPEQIAGWLKLTYPDAKGMHVSHETIYKSLFVQTRGLFRKELRNHLRSKRKFRHAKGHKPGSGQQIVEGVSIRERPAAVEDRAVPGHWEGDLICGSKNSYIATVVERHTRFTILVKVDGKKTDCVVPALARQMTELPDRLKQSLTWDRGTELASHQKFTVSTDIDVYFCDPSSPWQRGTNENTNGLLRQYFPKGSCLSSYSQEQLDEIANHLNNRPRKSLGFLTPAHRLEQVLQ